MAGFHPTGRRRRAHPSTRARLRGLPVVLARSHRLEKTLRSLVSFIIIAGIAVTTLGLASGLGSFAADLSRLVDYAGSGDTILASTLHLFQTGVLGLLGLVGGDQAGQEVSQIPDTGPAEPTYSSELPTGEGLVPYQVEVDGPPQEAPPLPTATPPQTNTPSQTSFPSDASQPQLSPTTMPEPTATQESPAVPGWIVIPSIGLDAPIIVSHTRMVVVEGKSFAQWEAPNQFAVGWQEGSSLLGVPGNTVLNGHHNIYGEVFGHLYQLNQGDEIIVYAGDRAFHYAVSQVMKIEERNASLQQREENARWVLPSTDERLTLVTCWPPTSNVYRLIVVAVPIK
jgi:LPXTG-site transpeptidase (sortase) family protein